MQLPTFLKSFRTTAADRVVELEAALAKKFSKHDAAIAAARTQLEDTTARAEFSKAPTAEKAIRIVHAQVMTIEAARVLSSMQQQILMLKDEEFEAQGRALVLAAIEELTENIDRRRLELTREDQRMSEESGYDIESTAAFKRLEFLTRQRDSARYFIGVNARSAWGALKPAYSEWRKTRKPLSDAPAVSREAPRAFALNGNA